MGVRCSVLSNRRTQRTTRKRHKLHANRDCPKVNSASEVELLGIGKPMEYQLELRGLPSASIWGQGTFSTSWPDRLVSMLLPTGSIFTSQ